MEEVREPHPGRRCRLWLSRRPWLGLVLALGIIAGVGVAGQGDFPASDPLWYAAVANRVAERGVAAFSPAEKHPFVMRVGLTVPVALAYRAFGVSKTSTNALAIAAALAITLVVFAAMGSPRQRWLAALACATCVPLLQQSALLNVDLPCAAWLALTTLALSKRDGPRGGLWLVVAMAAWFAAFLVKESALWLVPVWLYALVADLRAAHPATEWIDVREQRLWVVRRYAPAVGLGLALTAIYLVACARIWGSPLARFQGIDAITYEHTWTLHGKPIGMWLARLTWQPAALLFRLFKWWLVLAIVGVATVRGRDRIWVVALVVTLASYWFGSASLSSYSPLPLVDRMVMPVLPPLLVCAALGLDAMIARAAQTAMPRKRWLLIAGAIIAAIVLLRPAVLAAHRMVRAPRPETAALAAIAAELADPNSAIALVCGEPRCEAAARFFFGFSAPARLSLWTADAFIAARLAPGTRVRALCHAARAAHTRLSDPKADATPLIEALHLPVLAGNAAVTLYDAGDGNALRAALRQNR